jgi:hypothetical protein
MAKKIEDLTNCVFGYLTVENYGGVVLFGKKRASVWECRCKCGATCTVKHHNLMRGGTKSCGCFRREVASKDLIGQKFGKLTVISKNGYKVRSNNDRQVVWNCLCECDNIHLASTSLLCNGHVTSCGCIRKGKTIENLAGKTFGELTVVSFHERRDNRTFWLCKCSCGTEKSLDAHHLKSGNSKSCGCRSRGWKHGLTKDKKAYRKYLMKSPVRKLRATVGNQVRKAIGSNKSRASITKHLPYAIEDLKSHLENLWEPWMNWDNYGGRPNEKRKTWWIDHIVPQSNFAYTTMDDPLFVECWELSNLRPFEKIANMSKGNRNV